MDELDEPKECLAGIDISNYVNSKIKRLFIEISKELNLDSGDETIELFNKTQDFKKELKEHIKTNSDEFKDGGR